MSRRMERIEKWWQQERPRHFLWLPVCFGAGIGLYLGLPVEPPRYLLPLVLAIALVVSVLLWRKAKPVMIALVVIAFGSVWANCVMGTHPAQVLRQSLSPRPVIGVVEDIVRTEHGVRLTLDHVTIEGLAPELTPPQVRLSVRLKAGSELALPAIGDGIRIVAGLRPPMGPALPHGFDFARYFYFREIGAVGYGLPPWKVIAPGNGAGFATRFRNWRVGVTEDILATLGTSTGGIAAGLVTGDARAISQADYTALRASNLYHIIAISGEHMVVIAGVIFISLRLLALLLPKRWALRPEMKTTAAAVSLLLVTAYLFVTGLPISAVRAYIMIFLVLLAVILGRQVDAMRSLGITALLMLVYDPANLLDPGFELSFAATLAIIALVETTLLRPQDLVEIGYGRKAWRVFITMLLVSVVAEAATTPFVISQFNNVSPYGVLANMLATLLVSFYLMPTVALFFLLLPFGLQHGALWLMGFGIQGLLGIAYWVASFPHAQLFAPALPGYGVALFALGLLWLAIWQTKVRRWGLLPMLIGILTVTVTQLPDLMVGGELKQIVLRGNDSYVLARGRKGSMLTNLWANGLGYKELPAAAAPEWRCDALGCVAQVKGKPIAFPIEAAALAEDCRQADLIFTQLADIACAEGARVINQSTLKDSNVMAVWIDAAGRMRIEKSSDWQGKRPWSAVTASEEE